MAVLRILDLTMQDAKQSSMDAQAANLQLPAKQQAASQVRVDVESAALQKPETQEAVKQVQVDSESAQLQNSDTHQVLILGCLLACLDHGPYAFSFHVCPCADYLVCKVHMLPGLTHNKLTVSRVI